MLWMCSIREQIYIWGTFDITLHDSHANAPSIKTDATLAIIPVGKSYAICRIWSFLHDCRALRRTHFGLTWLTLVKDRVDFCGSRIGFLPTVKDAFASAGSVLYVLRYLVMVSWYFNWAQSRWTLEAVPCAWWIAEAEPRRNHSWRHHEPGVSRIVVMVGCMRMVDVNHGADRWWWRWRWWRGSFAWYAQMVEGGWLLREWGCTLLLVCVINSCDFGFLLVGLAVFGWFCLQAWGGTNWEIYGASGAQVPHGDSGK